MQELKLRRTRVLFLYAAVDKVEKETAQEVSVRRMRVCGAHGGLSRIGLGAGKEFECNRSLVELKGGLNRKAAD